MHQQYTDNQKLMSRKNSSSSITSLELKQKEKPQLIVSQDFLQRAVCIALSSTIGIIFSISVTVLYFHHKFDAEYEYHENLEQLNMMTDARNAETGTAFISSIDQIRLEKINEFCDTRVISSNYTNSTGNKLNNKITDISKFSHWYFGNTPNNQKFLICQPPNSGFPIFNQSITLNNLKDNIRLFYNITNDKERIKIIQVRHPVDRLFIAWQTFFKKSSPNIDDYVESFISTGIVKNKYGIPENYVCSFSDFIEYWLEMEKSGDQNNISSSASNLLNYSWRSLLYDCMPCKVDYDIVVKFENIEEDRSRAIEAVFNSTTNSTSTFDVRRNSSSGQIDLQEVSDLLPMALKLKLKQQINNELMLFGYSF